MFQSFNDLFFVLFLFLFRFVFSCDPVSQRRVDTEKYFHKSWQKAQCQLFLGNNDFYVWQIGANSWGTDWGENGFFRIDRQKNETKINSLIIAVWGNLWRLKAYNIREIQKLVQARKRLRLMEEFQNDGGVIRHHGSKVKRFQNIVNNKLT